MKYLHVGVYTFILFGVSQLQASFLSLNLGGNARFIHESVVAIDHASQGFIKRPVNEIINAAITLQQNIDKIAQNADLSQQSNTEITHAFKEFQSTLDAKKAIINGFKMDTHSGEPFHQKLDNLLSKISYLDSEVDLKKHQLMFYCKTGGVDLGHASSGDYTSPLGVSEKFDSVRNALEGLTGKLSTHSTNEMVRLLTTMSKLESKANEIIYSQINHSPYLLNDTLSRFETALTDVNKFLADAKKNAPAALIPKLDALKNELNGLGNFVDSKIQEITKVNSSLLPDPSTGVDKELPLGISKAFKDMKYDLGHLVGNLNTDATVKLQQVLNAANTLQTDAKAANSDHLLTAEELTTLTKDQAALDQAATDVNNYLANTTPSAHDTLGSIQSHVNELNKTAHEQIAKLKMGGADLVEPSDQMTHSGISLGITDAYKELKQSLETLPGLKDAARHQITEEVQKVLNSAVKLQQTTNTVTHDGVTSSYEVELVKAKANELLHTLDSAKTSLDTLKEATGSGLAKTKINLIEEKMTHFVKAAATTAPGSAGHLLEKTNLLAAIVGGTLGAALTIVGGGWLISILAKKTKRARDFSKHNFANGFQSTKSTPSSDQTNDPTNTLPANNRPLTNSPFYVKPNYHTTENNPAVYSAPGHYLPEMLH